MNASNFTNKRKITVHRNALKFLEKKNITISKKLFIKACLSCSKILLSNFKYPTL